MVKVVFYEWVVGMRKIHFIRLLNEKCGFSLATSKQLKDNLVDSKSPIEFFIANTDLAQEIIEEAKGIGVIGKIVKD